MIEATLFLIVGAIALTSLLFVFHVTWVRPEMLVFFLFLFILPGMYAAVTSGPFVPSNRKRHNSMMILAGLKKSDTVYDLGCGDGRLVRSASPHVKRAVGYELSIPLVLYGKLRGLFQPNISIRWGDIWKQDMSEADVIFCYLMPGAMKRFYRDVWPTLKKGTRVVSNAFTIHELKPDEELEKVYLYIKK